MFWAFIPFRSILLQVSQSLKSLTQGSMNISLFNGPISVCTVCIFFCILSIYFVKDLIFKCLQDQFTQFSVQFLFWIDKILKASTLIITIYMDNLIQVFTKEFTLLVEMGCTYRILQIFVPEFMWFLNFKWSLIKRDFEKFVTIGSSIGFLIPLPN